MDFEEKIRAFIVRDLGLPAERADILAPEWAKAAANNNVEQAVPKLTLPDKAPELYAERKVRPELGRKENPIEFLQRVWGKYMEAGILFRDDLNRCDPRLQPNIESYCQRMRQEARKDGVEGALEKWQAQHFLPSSGRDRPIQAEAGSVEFEAERKKAMRRGYTAKRRSVNPS